MECVNDELARNVGVECCGNDTGSAVSERRHRVEKVGYVAHTNLGGFHCGFIICAGMTDRHNNVGISANFLDSLEILCVGFGSKSNDTNDVSVFLNKFFIGL